MKNYRRATYKKLKSELHGAKKLMQEAKDEELPSFEYMRGYVRGLELAIALFKYYALQEGKLDEINETEDAL
jgi:hypothetical protein